MASKASTENLHVAELGRSWCNWLLEGMCTVYHIKNKQTKTM